MDIFLDTFRNRPGKSISSFIVAIFSIITLVWFQEMSVASVSEFFEYVTSDKDNTILLLTWGFNLMTFVLLSSFGMVWIKDVMYDNEFDISPVIGRLISFVIGMLHLAYSLLFLNYIFSNLLGIVIFSVIVFLCFYDGGSSSRK